MLETRSSKGQGYTCWGRARDKVK